MAGFRRGKRTWEERHSRKRSPVGTALGLSSRLALGRLAPPGARRRQLQTGTTRRAFPLRARRSLITAAPPSRGDPVASGRCGAAPSPRPAVPPRAAAAGNRARERVGHGGTCPAAAKWPPPRVCPPAAGGAARSAGGGRRGAAMERRAASEEEAAPAVREGCGSRWREGACEGTRRWRDADSARPVRLLRESGRQGARGAAGPP